ncbi:Cadmium, zinc and cobalt-transporting ATPase [bioreactor metagenome]|uniref:Cadmium, zinc and cobalt-transporting ATPase n=1 Tax=bioreactor metagenome TaxID=1076179 RepID=A0A645ITR1_9ZZZZ
MDNRIKKLKEMGMEKIVMLTGDSKLIGEKVARQLGIDNVYSELLPSEKVDKIEELLNKSPKSGNLIFVGDGINDAPVLARADIGMAMGALGSDAAIEAADIVIMTDEPSKVVTAINIAKRTLLIAKQNIVFALGVKLIVLIMGALGYATMWEAVFADVGVSVIAILNAMRALNTKKY